MTPLDETIRSVNTLDFGTVGVGGAKTLTFIVTNKSYPHGSQDITVSLSGFFTLGAGDDSFTLADYDDERTIEVTYSPEAVQNDDATLSFTTTATYVMPDVAVTAEGVSCTYSLPTIYNNPAGDMKIDLIIDSLVPGLTIPTTVKVLDIGVLTELIDVQPGIVDVGNLDIELAEEYNATYPAGFWYSLIQGYPDYQVQFRFILNEGGTDTFYFWGKVYREDVQWPEHYISTAEDDVIRTVSIKLVSLVHSLKDIPVTDALSEMMLHVEELTIPPADDRFYLTVKQAMASIAKVCFGDAYDETSIVVRGSDFVFDTIYTTEDALIMTSGSSLWRGLVSGETGQADNPHWWGNQFSSCYELLAAVSLNFGWVVRHYYGLVDGTYDTVTPANNLHRLEFLTRGTSYAGFIIPEEGITESTLHSDSVLKAKNIRVTDIHQANDQFVAFAVTRYDTTTGSAWSIRDAEFNCPNPQIAAPADGFAITEAPKHASFDLDINLQFILPAWYDSGGMIYTESQYRSLGRPAGANISTFEEVKFWDYSTGAWSATLLSMENAVMQYFNRRFSPGRKQYERQYGSLKFTEGLVTSHVNLKPMKRIQINDQLATENYYATEVRKDFKANRSTVLWIQE